MALDEREFELINIIGAKLGSNQRDLSRRMDLSLGQTNMLVRRLVSKGFIRISQLNKRKVRYLLTPQGMAEKMRKSVKYTINTISSIGLIKDNLRSILSRLYDKGHRVFFVVGRSDLVILVEMIFFELNLEGARLQRIPEVPAEKEGGLVLICQEDLEQRWSNLEHCINLIEELAKAQEFIYERSYS